MNTLRFALNTFFAAVMWSGLTTPAFAAPYKVDTLEPSSNLSMYFEPTDINANGEVVGQYSNSDGYSNSVYWNSAGQLTELTPGDTRAAITAGISDGGTAVYSELDRFYAWNAGTVTDLGAGFASAVNGKGQIAGTFGGVFGVLTDGVVSPLPLPVPGTYAAAYDINNNGDVVGLAYFSDTNSYRAVVWRNGTVQQIGTLPGDVRSVANAINDAGQVAGYSVSSTNKWRAFIWDSGAISDLSLATDAQSFAFGINNAGQVVGGFGVPGASANHPFVWQNGVRSDLQSVVGDGNCSLNDINNAGQIIASCYNDKALRLTPVASAGDLSVTLNATPIPATVGLPLVYTTTVTNIGNATTTDATLTQMLPPSGFTMGSITSTKGSCSGTTIVSCAFGDLAAGESAVVKITATPVATGSFAAYYDTSVVAATSTQEENTVNNATKLHFAVFENNAALSVHSVNSQTTAKKGTNITYTWNVSNGGPLNASNVVLTDTLPRNLSLVSVKTTLGTCSGTVTIKCDLGNYQYSGITVTIVAKAKVSGTIANSATVTSTTPDSYLGDNKATVITRVR